MRLLLSRQGNANAITPAGETPLSEAAKGGHELVVRALLQEGGRVGEWCGCGWCIVSMQVAACHQSPRPLRSMSNQCQQGWRAATPFTCQKGMILPATQGASPAPAFHSHPQAGATTESDMNVSLARAVAKARQANLPPSMGLVAAFSLTRGMGPTAPLCEAAARGHLGCVRALLDGELHRLVAPW